MWTVESGIFMLWELAEFAIQEKEMKAEKAKQLRGTKMLVGWGPVCREIFGVHTDLYVVYTCLFLKSNY